MPTQTYDLHTTIYPNGTNGHEMYVTKHDDHTLVRFAFWKTPDIDDTDEHVIFKNGDVEIIEHVPTCYAICCINSNKSRTITLKIYKTSYAEHVHYVDGLLRYHGSTISTIHLTDNIKRIIPGSTKQLIYERAELSGSLQIYLCEHEGHQYITFSTWSSMSGSDCVVS